MVKIIKDFFDDNKKILKKYNQEVLSIKNKVSELENNIEINDRQKYIQSELEGIKKLFIDLDYSKKDDLEKINNIFSDNKINLIALIILATKSLKEWKLIPYDTQIVGILSILDNNLVEMQTGEGKSLVSFCSALIKSLYGKTVNIISINHFLIERDYKEFSPLAEYLNISIGVISENLDEDKKRIEYSKNIVYSTHQDIIFDYLKDNMFLDLNKILIKDFYFVIIDEIDAILIDSALTPIMFSIPTKHNPLQFMEYLAFAKELKQDGENYIIEPEVKNVEITDKGIKKIEELLNIENIYMSTHYKYIEGVKNALKSIFIFKNKEAYIIKDQKIVIIDSTTGRPILGRTFPSGIQQAIEAKEGIEISKENKILASITYQNFFKLFSDFSGLTGTLSTEKDEFFSVYGKHIVSIPRLQKENKTFLNDLFFKTYNGKIKFLIEYIKEISETKQPLLIGAANVEKAEQIYRLLEKEGIKSKLLTASNHSDEAKIIKEAGNVGAITIVTSMAGRGTDIKVSNEANKLGGLFVIGVERGKSRRIDNQLSGRVGRQGDYGTVLFLLSPDDDIIIQTNKQEGLQNIFNTFYKDKKEDEAIQVTDMIVSAILKIQANLENTNYETRKYLLGYDKSLTLHRSLFYKKRKEILSITNVKKLEDIIIENINTYIDSIKKEDEMEIFDMMSNSIILLRLEDFDNYKENVNKYIIKMLSDLKLILKKDYEEILLMVIMNNMDNNWSKHLTKMSDLKMQLAFISYMQRDPISEYNKEAYNLYSKLQDIIKLDNLKLLNLLYFNYKELKNKENIKQIISLFGKDEEEFIDEENTPLSKEELNALWLDIKAGGLIDFSIPENLRPLRKHELSFIWGNMKKYGIINNSELFKKEKELQKDNN